LRAERIRQRKERKEGERERNQGVFSRGIQNVFLLRRKVGRRVYSFEGSQAVRVHTAGSKAKLYEAKNVR